MVAMDPMDEGGSKRLIEEHDGSTVSAVLQGDLTVAAVDAVKDELFALLNSELIRLDLGQLEEVDTCGLQLLLIFQRQAAIHKRTLEVIDVPPQLADLLDLYGLSGFPDVSAQEGQA